MNIYVASSWRNPRQPDVVKALREDDHVVYDFRNPAPGDRGFKWSDIDPTWEDWSPAGFCESLEDPLAVEGFRKDMAAVEHADVVVLVMPCGPSSHLEIGYAAGKGKTTAILLDKSEPELMYKMVDEIFVDLQGLRLWLAALGNLPVEASHRRALPELQHPLADALGLLALPTCRVCGCTDDNCSQCVERTGEPCHWVEPDLCSACVEIEGGG